MARIETEQVEGTACAEDEQIPLARAAQHRVPTPPAAVVREQDHERRAGRVHERHAAHVQEEDGPSQSGDPGGGVGAPGPFGQVEVTGDADSRLGG